MRIQHPGQSLLEAILAIAIIIASTIAATTVVISTSNAGSRSTDNVIGQNFAREGIEIVRGIRDSNWLKRAENITHGGSTVVWDDDWTTAGYQSLGGHTYATLFTPSTGTWSLILNPSSSDQVISEYIKTGDNSYLTQQCPITAPTTCTTTNFSRLITITKDTPPEQFFLAGDATFLDITSDVSWQDHGTRHAITNARLYDWR